MQCPRCQAENREEARFCRECGATFESICSSCGAKVEAGSRFCDGCGAPLAAPSPHATRSSHLASPDSYTPKHLAEKILTSRAALEGERKQVTVLFADLKGSMEMLADRDPEEARKLLDPVLERMMEAVHHYEGTVNQVMGDGIMALFGAPLAHEDHAVRACYAALRMQESIKQYAKDAPHAQGVPIQIRVGLNSGEVVVRTIGSDLRMDYTAVGQTTHLAARMEQLAGPGSVLMAPATLHLVEGYVEVKGRGPIPVKGLPDPVEVYELTGAGPVRSRLQVAVARGLTGFVARGQEMNQLGQALERARNGHGQVVAVVGEPGVGKSRLYWEFLHSHHTQGWLVLESRSVSYGKATSYLPVIDLLKGYFQIEPQDESTRTRERVGGKLLTLDGALQRSLPALLALLDLPVDDVTWQALDPPQRRHRMLDAVRHLLLRESQVQPVLVAFEDLHWIDNETQALLDRLVEDLPATRILLLTNYRPEYEHQWMSKTYYTQLRLDSLPPGDAADFLRMLLGDSIELEPLKRLLIERTEGNPFFLEESVRTLIETRVLVGEPAAYRVNRPLEGMEVPATVEAVLTARIDRLPSEEKRLLQAAAVVGKDVPYPVLAAIADVEEPDIQHGLAHLQASEFLYPTRLFPDLEYTFKHALTQQVAYGSILQDRRRGLHAQIVKAIERLQPDLPDDEVSGLANHATKGELWEEAVRYHRRAGQRAVDRSANREAVTHFEQALAALEPLPADRHRLEQSCALHFELRMPVWFLGDMTRALALGLEAEQEARTLGDEPRIGWASVFLFNVFWMTGRPHEARTYAVQAASAARALGDYDLQVVSSVNVAQLFLTSGDFRGVQGEAKRALDVSEDRPSGVYPYRRRRYRPQLRALLGHAEAALGNFEEGIALGRVAIQEAEGTGNPFSLLYAIIVLDRTYRLRGSFNESAVLVDRAFALINEYDLTVILASAIAHRGYNYVHSGRVADGVTLLQQASDLAKSQNIMFDLVLITLDLGEAYLAAGQLDRARECAREAMSLARERGELAYEAAAAALLGDIASSCTPCDIAAPEQHYANALRVLEDIGMRPFLACCHLRLGTLYGRNGKGQAAREQLATAARMLTDMGMTYWLEKVEAEMKGLG